jgi:DNA primase large subunit
MHDDSVQGKNLPHEARFALAAFLLKIGMSQDEVLGVFRSSPDFVTDLARYQVRHISSKSGGQGYTPPGCKKIQGNGLCPVYLGVTFDPLCEYILHPLAFYKTRAWETLKGIESRSWYAAKKRKRQSLS